MGYDKKLMSDKYIEVDAVKKYQLSLKMRNSAPLLVHLGLACFDEHKNAIAPVQVCRIEGTDVLVEKLEANRIYISQNTRQNLKKWRINEVFSYQKCIGIYQNGDLGKVLNLQQVIFVENDCYSKQPDKGAYSIIGQDYIQLTEDGAALLKQSKNFIQQHHTKLMNHYQGGTYVIGKTEDGYFDDWKVLNFNVGGGERKNEGHSFLIGTKYVRILLMANYNSGYPDFHIANKQGTVDFCQIEWSCM